MNSDADDLVELLSQDAIAGRVSLLARRLVPTLTPDTVLVCMLLGGLWFAADLARALAREGLDLPFDALWLSSYTDGEVSSGKCEVRAGLQRSVKGQPVLLVDDVIDSGVSLSHAVTLMQAAEAGSIRSVVFARKPWPRRRAVEPDDFAYDAPARFLVGYGMDAAGLKRGRPGLWAAA